MTQLPNEILLDIFSFLKQHDKLRCMLVCRRWNQIIEQSALFEDVSISSEVVLSKLSNKIQLKPDIAKKIKNVSLYLGQELDYANLTAFLPLLSNIRTLLCISGSRLLTAGARTQYPSHKLTGHRDAVSYHSITHSLLSSTICTRLHTLEIKDFERNIIPYLRNAPALENLTLGGNRISLDDLEHIHVNAPHLKALSIHHLTFEDTHFNTHITPAMSVTTCSLDRIWLPNLSSRIDILSYICKKYPNLSRLIVNFGKLGGGFDDNIDALNYHGWYPLFQSVGTKLKQLFIGDSDCTDSIFQTLDKFSCQLHTLEIRVLSYSTFAKIEKSQQIQYIQTLKLQNMEFDSFSWLKQFQAIKKLRLENVRYTHPRNTIYLNDIIKNAPPTLRVLSFANTSITINLKNTHVTGIETLSFYCVTIPDKIGAFIQQCFPRLRKLKVKSYNDIE